MDRRLELLKATDRGIFVTKKNFLREPGESGYIAYRLLRPLLKLRYSLFRKLNSPSPWLSPTSVKFLNKFLTSEMTMFEFGSGISTIFLASRVGHLTSVEHNSEWYAYIKKTFEKPGFEHVDYQFIPSNDPLKESYQDLDLEFKPGFTVRRDYVDYFLATQKLPDESLDVLLIDGRARPECLYYALPKMKKCSVIVLDNSERKRYSIIFELLKEYPSYTTTNGLTDTTFWFLGNIA